MTGTPWRVFTDDEGQLFLVNTEQERAWPLDADEAFDLGDDLIISADRSDWQKGVTPAPPWLQEPHIVRWGAMTLLACPHCTDDICIDQLSLAEVVSAAREHWTHNHAKEVNSEKRPDGRPDETVRGGNEAAPAAPDVHNSAA